MIKIVKVVRFVYKGENKEALNNINIDLNQFHLGTNFAVPQVRLVPSDASRESLADVLIFIGRDDNDYVWRRVEGWLEGN